MSWGCNEMQEAIVEAGGRVEALHDDARLHLRSCPSCDALARQERALALLLESAVPAEDAELEGRVLAAVAAARTSRRLRAFLPVAASLLIALAGAVLLGGVPGGSLLTRVPAWSAQTWFGLVGQLGDWGLALTVLARTGGAALPGAALAVAGAVALGGFGGLTAVAVRWRRNRPW